MAKIGTAQIEIKPVLNAEALALIAAQIEQAVRAAVERGVMLAVEDEDKAKTAGVPRD